MHAKAKNWSKLHADTIEIMQLRVQNAELSALRPQPSCSGALMI